MKATVAIPDALIHEQNHGEPVYYRDYRLYLSGEKSIEEIMGSSYLPSLIISKLLISLSQQLGSKYTLLSNK